MRYSIDLSGIKSDQELYVHLSARFQHYDTQHPIALKLKNTCLVAEYLEKPATFYLDFTQGPLTFRGAQASIQKEAIARAVGIKSGKRPHVLDTTAGLCRDSYILAMLGCRVTAIERDPLVYTLVEDGLRRADISRERLDYQLGSSIAILKKQGLVVDTIYLDPMFPERKKSAKVKKDMQFLQTIVGPDQDSDTLLHVARNTACGRVVVKRPAYATPVGNMAPDFIIRSKKFRFDIYQKVR